MRQDSQNCENQPPEPAPSKTSEISHTIHTYLDISDTTDNTNCCVLEKFEEKLRYCGIHLYVFDENSEIKNYAGNGISPNPLMKGIREILKGMEEEEAERAIATFLTWLSTAKNVRCKYAAFASALRSKWKG